MKKVFAYIKNHIFSFCCLFVALAVCISGSITYSKYLSTSTQTANLQTGKFGCSAKIDNISALSFANTAFWGNTSSDSDEQIALNVVRNVEISVNNFATVDDNKVVSEVPVEYIMSFSAPAAFVKTLAFQILSDSGSAVIPQIVIGDLIAAMPTDDPSAVGSFDTSASTDYNGTSADDIQFQVKNKGFNSGTVRLEATSSSAIINIESETKNVEQTAEFRLWDVSALSVAGGSAFSPSEEGGNLLKPVLVRYDSLVEIYHVSIRVASFVFEPNVAQTQSYSLRIVPVVEVDELTLGGYLNYKVDSDRDNYIDANAYFQNTEYERNKLGIAKQISSSTSVNLNGITIKGISINGRELEENEKFYFYEVQTNGGVESKVRQIYHVGLGYSVTYPLEVNVTFEQTTI